MTAYVLQRLIQSVLVLLAVSIVVFLAVYGIGDPIELLVSPAGQRRRARGADPAPRASTCRSGSNTSSSSGQCPEGRSRPLLRPWRAGDRADPRATAGHLRARAAGDERLRIVTGIPLGLLAGLDPESRAAAHHHGRHGAGLFASELLEGHDADPALRASCSAGCRRRGAARRFPSSASRRAC